MTLGSMDPHSDSDCDDVPDFDEEAFRQEWGLDDVCPGEVLSYEQLVSSSRGVYLRSTRLIPSRLKVGRRWMWRTAKTFGWRSVRTGSILCPGA